MSLLCRAKGFPEPTVTWRRSDGKMPIGRTHVINDKTLQLTELTAHDSGIYVCEAQNIAGVMSVKTYVTVVAAPELVQKPHDKQVIVGEDVELSCNVKGDPHPLLLWRLPDPDRSAVLAGGHSKGHTSVIDSGSSLIIEDTRPNDSGTYQCWGISTGGSVSSRADVFAVESFPPPLIGIGPRDQNVLPGTTITMSCEVSSEAATPIITWWYREASHMPANELISDNRISLPLNGALILKDVIESDAGIYTCRASSTTGTVEAASLLKVGEELDKTNKRIKLPAPPSKPRIISVNETSVELSWLPNSRMDGAKKLTYTVEYWRPGWQEWRIAEAQIKKESCIIKNLSPNVVYSFLIRAVSSNNQESFPSPWSDLIRTSEPQDPSMTLEDIRQARRKLIKPAVTLLSATATSPEKVMLRWKMAPSSEGGVEGMLVYSHGQDGTIRSSTVLGSASSSHLVRGLSPNTRYTFFLVPFWRNVEGTPSNSYQESTPEDGKL